MANDVPGAEEIKALLAVSRKRALSFGICLGKKPDTTVLLMDRKKSSDMLMRMAKKAGDTPKVTCGKIETNGKKVVLSCSADVPPGLAKQLRRYLNSLGISGVGVTIADTGGAVLEEDGDEEEQETATDDAAQAAPADDDAGDDAGDDGAATPDGPAQDAETSPDADAKRALVADLAAAKPVIVETLAKADPADKALLQDLIKSFGTEMKAGEMGRSQTIMRKIKETADDVATGITEEGRQRRADLATIRSRAQAMVARLDQLEADKEAG